MLIRSRRVKKTIRFLLGSCAATVAVIVVATISISAFDRRASLRAWRSRELYIPPDQRRLLTNGTTDGVPWLEEQLQSQRGRMVALYILSSMMTEALEPFPMPFEPLGFCGNTPRGKRRQVVRQHVRASLKRQEESVALYFTGREQRRFKPLPVVDWNDLQDIESKALAAIEAKDIGMLMVLLEWKATTWVPRIAHPHDERQIRFARAGAKYDVRLFTQSRRRVLACEILGEHSNDGMWFNYRIEDVDGDGLAGISRPRFHSSYGSQDTGPATQPWAPRLSGSREE